jgi:hypothetical protein
MNCPQWVVDAVLLGAGALTLKAGVRHQVSGLRKIVPLNFLRPDT